MSKELKIVRVLDDYKIVMNAGSDKGVALGQKYLLYELSDEEIIDPDTNKSLGYLEIVKGTGVVTHVQPLMSTLESDVYRISSKKILRKNPFIGALSETIEESESEREQIPFDYPRIGNLLKRVN